MKTELQSRKIRWGILGLGNIANKFAQDLLTVPHAELYAVASRTRAKADAFALKYGARIAYDNYTNLAEDPDVDAVYIATPHALHREKSIQCLTQGKAVLCEKPFAMNLHEVEEMIACAQANDTLLMEALWTYFLPHYQYVSELIKTKAYGDLQKIEADFGFSRPFDDSTRLFNKTLGGGSLLDIGIYPIFVALSNLGVPDRINAQATFFDNGVDASCTLEFQYKKNVKAVLKSSVKADLPTEAVFHCEKGVIKINRMFFMPTTVSIFTNGQELIKDFKGDTLGYNYEIMHFNQLLRQGKNESNIMTFEFSRNLIKLLDQVRNKIDLHY